MYFTRYQVLTVVKSLHRAMDWEESIKDSMNHMRDDPEYKRAVDLQREFGLLLAEIKRKVA